MPRRHDGVVIGEGIVEQTVDGKQYRGRWTLKRFGVRTPEKVITVVGDNFTAGAKTTQLGNMDAESLAYLLLAEMIGQRKSGPDRL